MSSNFRVVHLTNSMKLDGTGLTNSSVDLALEQVKAGHRVAVMCDSADDPMRKLLQAHGVHLVEGVDASTPWAAFRSARRSAPWLLTADVLHVHTVRATIVACLAAPLRFLTRSVSTLHNPYQRSVKIMYLTSRIVSISSVDQRFVRRRTASLRRPAVVLNGVLGSGRLPAVDELAPAELPEHAVVFVGALYARKGVDVLLEAMVAVRRAVPTARLYLVGNRDNPELERLASALGLDDVVEFVGFVPDPRVYMMAASVFVLPSRAEGFGNVLTEARSVGVPVVATDVGGIPEALSGGRAGLLVASEDVQGLARALVDVLTDAQLQARLRAAGAEGLDGSSIERAQREYEEVYVSLPGLRSRRGLPFSRRNGS